MGAAGEPGRCCFPVRLRLRKSQEKILLAGDPLLSFFAAALRKGDAAVTVCALVN